MKTISNWNDLTEYGILPLTGEACTLSARLLCDLTEAGCANIREFMGLPYNSTFQAAWNNEGVASMFLPYSILPDLAAFLLLKSGCVKVAHIKQHGICGIEATDDTTQVENWITDWVKDDLVRTYQYPNHTRNGASNVHAMSGRSQ